MGLGALVATARQEVVGLARRRLRGRGPAQTTGILVGALALGVVFWAAKRSGQEGWRLWRQPLLVALVAWVLVWAVYIALDPGIVVHSWVILPQPYVEGLKYLATNDTGARPGSCSACPGRG